MPYEKIISSFAYNLKISGKVSDENGMTLRARNGCIRQAKIDGAAAYW